VHDDHKRLFYIQQTRRNGWSKNVLVHQIENRAYQQILLGQQNFTEALPEATRAPAAVTLKDEYTFDFLNLPDPYSEHELEQAILANIRRFLIEMGVTLRFWATSTPSNSTATNTGSTCCCTTANCGPWWPWN
jgi:predicted nuclease of restriction endonuclease-like (RecB) superfamily